MSAPLANSKPFQKPLFWVGVTGIIGALGVVISILWPGLSLDDRAKLAGAFAALGIGAGNVGSSLALKGGQEQAEALHAENAAKITDVAIQAGVTPPESKT